MTDVQARREHVAVVRDLALRQLGQRQVALHAQLDGNVRVGGALAAQEEIVPEPHAQRAARRDARPREVDVVARVVPEVSAHEPRGARQRSVVEGLGERERARVGIHHVALVVHGARGRGRLDGDVGQRRPGGEPERQVVDQSTSRADPEAGIAARVLADAHGVRVAAGRARSDDPGRAVVRQRLVGADVGEQRHRQRGGHLLEVGRVDVQPGNRVAQVAAEQETDIGGARVDLGLDGVRAAPQVPLAHGERRREAVERAVRRGRLEQPGLGRLEHDLDQHLVALPFLERKDLPVHGAHRPLAEQLTQPVVELVQRQHGAGLRQPAEHHERLRARRSRTPRDAVLADAVLGHALDVHAVQPVVVRPGRHDVARLGVRLGDPAEVLLGQRGRERVARLQRQVLGQRLVGQHGVAFDPDRLDLARGVGRAQLERHADAAGRVHERHQPHVAATAFGQTAHVGEQGVVVEQVPHVQAEAVRVDAQRRRVDRGDAKLAQLDLEHAAAQLRGVQVDAALAVAQLGVALADAAHGGPVCVEVERLQIGDEGELVAQLLLVEHGRLGEHHLVEPGGLVDDVAHPKRRILAALGQLGRTLGLERDGRTEREALVPVAVRDRAGRLVRASDVEHPPRREQMLPGQELPQGAGREALDPVEDHLADLGVLLHAHQQHRTGRLVEQRHADAGERAESVHAVPLGLEVDPFRRRPDPGGDQGPHDVGVDVGALDADLDQRSAHVGSLGESDRRGEKKPGEKGREGARKEGCAAPSEHAASVPFAMRAAWAAVSVPNGPAGPPATTG